MKAFVTGANGLLGSNLVNQLLAQGFVVKALVRSRQKAEQLLPNSPDLTLIEGDMENVTGFAGHLQGIDVLFHTAACFREAFSGIGDHWDKLQKINITETIRLFELAEKQGVRRIIHTSSVASIANLNNGRLATEADLEEPEQAREPYAKSKIERSRDRSILQNSPYSSHYRSSLMDVWTGRRCTDFRGTFYPGLFGTKASRHHHSHWH